MLEFKDRNQFEDAIVEAISADLNVCLKAENEVRILLSGGSTPGPIYQRLNREYSQLNALKIGLVDERYVNHSHPRSNELLLRNCFSNMDKNPSLIVGMVCDTEDKEENLRLARIAYKPFAERTDLVVLGMGTDGHTASFFPGDESSHGAIQSKEATIFTTTAPDFPTERMTCSYALLKEATTIYLLISGEKKKEVLAKNEADLPIHQFLADRPDVKIYYLDHD